MIGIEIYLSWCGNRIRMVSRVSHLTTTNPIWRVLVQCQTHLLSFQHDILPYYIFTTN